ncbi:hypothetical protein ACWGR4_29705 [Embleya sp. NPDC055664]|uniref:hypothetical protein n=1 Tax=Embleya sp. NPDC059237 TaxID=3346784 RepID=UPI0036800906
MRARPPAAGQAEHGVDLRLGERALARRRRDHQVSVELDLVEDDVVVHAAIGES